ncbi:MAG: hypothetical protein L3K03_00190 [Thermoplasmata archaeon]|nr:hypothetical protein [Thermoplasmata archaeon]
MSYERPLRDGGSSRRSIRANARRRGLVILGTVAFGVLVARLLTLPGTIGSASLVGVGFRAVTGGLRWVGGAGLGVAGVIQRGIGWVGGAGLGVAGTP